MTAEGDTMPISLIRSAWAGSAKYGALVWSGDIVSTFECFQRQVQAGLNMAVAGIPWWTTDIGGFHGARTDDPDFHRLYIRWFEYGCFCPVMRLHGNRNQMCIRDRSICRCYLIRDFFDVAVRIQQIDQFTVDLRHITVDLIDIELCRIGNIDVYKRQGSIPALGIFCCPKTGFTFFLP